MSFFGPYLRRWRAADGSSAGYMFWCPGCDTPHSVRTEPDGWRFNGSLSAPSFQPSLLLLGARRCHSYVTDGRIQFLGDSWHKLAGHAVPLPDRSKWPDWFRAEAEETD